MRSLAEAMRSHHDAFASLPRSHPTITAALASAEVRLEAIEDARRWNVLVQSFPGYELEQGWEWAEVLRRSGARPHRSAVFADGRCIGAVSVLGWHLGRLGLAVLDAPRGPLVAPDDGRAWPGLTAALAQVASVTGAVFARISPPVADGCGDTRARLLREGFVPLPEQWTLWNAPKIVMTLDLNGGEADLWGRISNRRRREIRLAERAGITIEGGGAADVADFYHLLLGMGRSKRYPVRRLGHFEALHRAYRAGGAEAFLTARWRGRLVGGLLGARFGARAYLLYSAVDRELPGDAVRAGPLLYWRFIRWAKAEGCQVVHWGGSGTNLPPDAHDPGYGVYQFKRSFGSSCWAYLGYADLVFRPRLYAVARTAERRLSPLVWRVRAILNR